MVLCLQDRASDSVSGRPPAGAMPSSKGVPGSTEECLGVYGLEVLGSVLGFRNLGLGFRV